MEEAVHRTAVTMAAVGVKATREKEESGVPTCLAGRGREKAKATISGEDRMPPTPSGETSNG